MQLTAQQERLLKEARSYVAEEIAPYAGAWDEQQAVPDTAVAGFAARGHLGALVPQEYGGAGLDAVSFGLLNEAVGYGCSSMRSLLTVHSMVVHAVARWGSERQRATWLPRLASGESVGAFGLSEREAGSDASQLRTTAEQLPEGNYTLSGRKMWTTFGQRADVFLVFARLDGRITAFLVERRAPGLEVVPVSGMLGTRASRLAELRFDDCRVPADAVVGRPGFGLTAVALSALDVGRYSVAWGCVGLLAACADASVSYAQQRLQFGKPLGEHQLIRRMIADMVTDTTAARLLCLRAGRLKDLGDPETVNATWMAKYFASVKAFRAAADTVQIFGAVGCSEGHPAQRMLRDAKVMEIIEGSTEVQQDYLAQAALRERAG
ncbi:acyl-CoA dehydrogenase family protein [Dactylosporangium fulvum]|uniref:Acyl-CoA dehydrogenase family protein n=1 Tax=Dactylosporangium fulvum TaxID=53359 RepID=A0ABY5W5R5_9ACTN|nr:acyl-CoA dehydrogenase family protein [Dactylosporangium fulvum]UWP85402.1 acyl-CoA dehydrogenase family protein [Dactylosporangium fulvum]